jgi:hypothetical protein
MGACCVHRQSRIDDRLQLEFRNIHRLGTTDWFLAVA